MTDEPPPPRPLTRLRADLAGPRGARRIDALLSEPEPEAAVAALAPSEIFELVHEAGFADALDLLALATPEQVRGCLDLDGWDRDHVAIEPVRPWLAAVIELGYEKLGAVWEALDAELRALLLQRHATIYDLSLGEEPDDEDGAATLYATPDGFFCVKPAGGEDAIRLVIRLVDDLYRADAALARHTLMAARAEPPAELEEMAYRWRAGRMADLGYVDFYEALELFQPLEPDQVAIGEGTAERFGPVIEGDAPGAGRLPAAIAEELVGRSFLARALDRVEDRAEAERVEAAILVLTNKVLSAARIKPGDLEALRRGARYATATLSLGLETVARGDPDRAAAALTSIALTRLHRVGYTMTVRLARLARGLGPRAATADDAAAAALAALLAARPWMSRALDAPPGPGVRPFETAADLRRVAELLARLGLRIAIAEALGADLIAVAQAPEPRPALDDHARTALVRAMLGGGLAPAPLTGAELARFRAACFAGDALADAAQERAVLALTARLDAAGITAGRDQLPGLVAGWLADLERTFAPLDPAAPGGIDGRFVAGVIAAAARA